MQEQQRTALVTGASSGIGKEAAILLAAEGFQVIAAARRRERLVELADQYQGIIPKQVDLSDSKDLEAFCAHISELSQPVSVLVNNAGYATRGMLEDVTIDKIKRMFEVNVFSLIRVTQACLPGMRKARAGMIVNLSSIVGKFPFPGSGLYASTKHAVEAITDALRIELAPLGIKVVAIRPGAIATEFGQAAEKMTGDLFARTDPDYRPIYEAIKKRMDKIFENQSPSRPQLIAELIMEAVLSYPPRPAYTAGVLSDEFLGKRASLSDDEFFQFMLEKFDLANLKV